MATIHELTSDYLRLLELAEDPEVDEEAFRDTLEGLEGALEDKAQNYAFVIQELNAKEAGLKAEIDRLTARKRTVTNNIARIKKTLEDAMIATGKTKFKTDLFSFGIQKNPASVELQEGLDVYTVPDDYLVYSAPTVNKKAVMDAMKAGEEFSWATLKQTESLRIR